MESLEKTVPICLLLLLKKLMVQPEKLMVFSNWLLFKGMLRWIKVDEKMFFLYI